MFGMWKCYYKYKSGLSKSVVFGEFIIFITVAALVPPSQWSWQGNAAVGLASCCLSACGFSLPCQHVLCTDHSYFIEATWRLDLYKALPPYAMTATNEFLKTCLFSTKHSFSSSITMEGGIKLPSFPAQAFREAGCVNWKTILPHLRWEPVFYGLLSFGMSLIPRPRNAQGFSFGGTILLCSAASCARVSTSPLSHPLQLSSQCKFLPSDFSPAGNASSSSPQPAIVAGKYLAGFCCRAGAGIRR